MDHHLPLRLGQLLLCGLNPLLVLLEHMVDDVRTDVSHLTVISVQLGLCLSEDRGTEGEDDPLKWDGGDLSRANVSALDWTDGRSANLYSKRLSV